MGSLARREVASRTTGVLVSRSDDRSAVPLFVTLRGRVTGHFLRRLEERRGDPDRLVLEGGRLEAAGWLRPLAHEGSNLVVPGFGQIRLSMDCRNRGFVAVTFLPFGRN